MAKDQGLYNKPSAAAHPGALAAGTLPQYNTIHLLTLPAPQGGDRVEFAPATYVHFYAFHADCHAPRLQI